MTAEHTPTEDQRKTVEAMSSYGIPQENIAAVIGVDRKTLAKHYRKELDTATAKANAQVAQRLYKKCLDGDTTSMIFWMKTRGKWSEKIETENNHNFNNIHALLAGLGKSEQGSDRETTED